MKALENLGVADGLSGLLEWSEPVIFDRLRETYRARIVEEPLIWNLARQHCRAWRALIAGDIGKFEILRRELVGTLERRGLSVGCVADADARTLMELNEIVAARFQRCARLAKAYRLALIELAARLAPAGRAA